MDDDAPPGVPEWVVTYGDMMSLLLTFFIMLVSISQRKEEGRVRSMLDSFQETFGSDDAMNSGIPGVTSMTTSQFPVKKSSGRRSEGGVKKASRKTNGVRGASDPVQRLREGKRITLGGPTMFARFSAEPGELFTEAIDALSEVVSQSRRQIAVRGHASPEPLPADSEYDSHEQMAYLRALAVAEALEARGVLPQRLVLSTAGSREPRLRTRDPAEQRLNDRVDVFLIDAYGTAP